MTTHNWTGGIVVARFANQRSKVGPRTDEQPEARHHQAPALIHRRKARAVRDRRAPRLRKRELVLRVLPPPKLRCAGHYTGTHACSLCLDHIRYRTCPSSGCCSRRVRQPSARSTRRCRARSFSNVRPRHLSCFHLPDAHSLSAYHAYALSAGDTIFYNSNTLHRASYRSACPRTSAPTQSREAPLLGREISSSTDPGA